MKMFNPKVLKEDFARNPRVKKEITDLQNLISNPPKSSVVMEITPDIAHYVIKELNKNNRPVKPSHLMRYARDMLNNNWGLTGETIKFGSDGLLKDGQNRLMACFKVGKTFKTHVVFGVKPETFYQMDNGVTRGATDVLHIMGVPNSKHVSGAIKIIKQWKDGTAFTKMGIDNETVKRYYEEEIDADLILRAIKAFSNVYKIVKLPRNYMIALYYIAAENGHELLVHKFFEDIMQGRGKSSRAAVPAMLKTFNKWNMDVHHTKDRHELIMLVVRSWRNYKNDKNSKASDFIFSRNDTLGEI